MCGAEANAVGSCTTPRYTGCSKLDVDSGAAAYASYRPPWLEVEFCRVKNGGGEGYAYADAEEEVKAEEERKPPDDDDDAGAIGM